MPSDPSPPPAAGQELASNEDRVEIALKDADQLKQEGNDLFRASNWEGALSTYRAALGRLPPRVDPELLASAKGKARATGSPQVEEADDAESGDDAAGSEASFATAPEDTQAPAAPPARWDGDCAKARAVLNANIAACYVKLNEHKDAVKACGEALKDDPVYVKALQRRAASNEALNTWGSMAAAQEDYEKLLTLVPASQAPAIRTTLARLAPRKEAAQKQEMGEMVDKLKGIGNSLLGNFGLSTDNFKFEPNGQGGYSVNFSR